MSRAMAFRKPSAEEVVTIKSKRPRITDVKLLSDYWLLFVIFMLLGTGIVMVGSSSFEIADRKLDQPLYYLIRQMIYVTIGVLVAAALLRLPLEFWEKMGGYFLMAGVLSLILVLVPGVGREINGSMRWLSLGIVNVQPSEFAKLFVIVYMAGYLVRHGDSMQTTLGGFVRPMAVLALVCVLLLAEPDFGAAAVILATAMAMMFLGGVRFSQFLVLMLLMGLAMAALAVSSPYRMERITGFMDPWADPFNSGFQLTQALIAFGRGEWFGVGLGSSVQKLFYLPEAHTDFLFAVLSEELGFVGGLTIIALFCFVVIRAFMIGRMAEKVGMHFASYLAYGIGIWIGIQAFINIGVNMGVLPTKGLTLPFMSYGGSSVLAMCIAISLLLRVDYERRLIEYDNHKKAVGNKKDVDPEGTRAW
ncbi:Cell division protein FtsW [hydrothermal vent metagenome]|uniref:peptidoglycan glycosyltransferase n=1 Tax=hydrothermal vent metagenome TaxID=652676 RepID=A0A3B0ZSZ4_9ZZZZ